MMTNIIIAYLNVYDILIINFLHKEDYMKSSNLIMLLFFLLSCSDSGNSEKTLSQSDIDRYTGFAIVDTASQIYNINFAGKPVGAQNLTTTCPQGGEVIITGSTGYSQNNGITTVDLILNMKDCKSSRHTTNGIDTTITLTGIMTFKGSFDSSRGYNATTHQSDSLKISGAISVTGFKTATVDETCPFTASINNETVSGYICSRQFSY
jgi:hypothetical protein